MADDKEIKDFNQLKVEYEKAKAEAEQHIRSDMKKFAEITRELPGLVVEATARGISNKIADIDKGFEDIDFAEIESEMSLGTLAGVKEVANEKWAKDNSNRSKIVTGTVTNAKNKITNMKAKMALSAVKVTSLVGKGLVLFGQKGLAKSMNETVTEKGEAFVSKDSRIGKIMERVAQRGFDVADGTRKTAKKVREGAVSAVETVEGGVKSAAKTVSKKAKSAKTSIEKGINDRKQAFRDAGTRADLDQMSIARERANKNRENEQWQNAHEGRSSIVTNTVKNIDKYSVDLKTKFALAHIKVTGVYAKSLALFGAKGLAEKMQEAVYKSNAKNISRESDASKIAKLAAEKGFKVSTGVKEGVKHTAEMAGAVKNAAVITAEETVEKGKQAIDKGKTAVKNGALEFGKKTYRGAAVIGALGDIGLGAVKTGARKVAGKVENGVEFVADKVEDGVAVISDKIEDAKDYKTVATARLSKQKSAVSKGFKGFLKGMAEGVIQKLGPSIDKDQKNIDTQEQIIESVKNKGSQEPKMQEATGEER